MADMQANEKTPHPRPKMADMVIGDFHTPATRMSDVVYKQNLNESVCTSGE
jgi:hypothetical protein